MKTSTLPRVGRENLAVRRLGLLAIALLLPGAASLQAQTPTKTATTVTTLGGGPQAYNPGSSYGYSNSVWGTLESQFHTPCGIAVDNGLGLIYVADRDNNAVRVIDGAECSTFVPYPPYVPTNLISQPVGVAVDALGNVYVLNRGNGANGTVVEIDYYGDYITNMTGITNASGIALDTTGDIFVTTSNTVFKITPAGHNNVVTTFNYTNTCLQGIVVKRSGPNAGKLAVCDSGRNGIYLIDPDTGNVTTNAGFNGPGDGTGIINRGIANSQAQFFQPSGLAEAGDGSLIVADFGNNRVKVVAATGYTTNLYGVSSNDWWTGTTPTGGSAVLGWSDGAVWEPDGGPGFGNVQARMPFGLAIGSDGTIYTTEDYYHIIRKVTGANMQVPLPWPPPTPMNPTATAGYGQVMLTWTASAGATNYNIKRSTSSGGETTVASTTGTSYTDMTNLLDGTTYYYVISAAGLGGPSTSNSPEVSATPLFSPAPTNLTVTATNYGLISLAWSPFAGATSYNVKRAPSHLGPYATVASAASTTYNDTSVSNGATYYYVVSAVNLGGENPTNSAEVSATVPIPPPPPPVIGWFDYEGTAPPVTVFHTVSGAAFITHNDLSLAIEPVADGVSTLYTVDDTNVLANGSTPPTYKDGLTSAPSLPVTIAPDVIIYAVNTNSGGSSAPVHAEFQFQVANPTIVGNNAAQFIVGDITTNAQLWYTTDGSTPDPVTNAAASHLAGTIAATSGITLSLSFPANTNVMTVTVRGFRDGYSPSGNAVQVFSVADFVPNTISFGFASGEASSDFFAAPGQTFIAPVTLTTLPGTTIYSLQFNLTANSGGTNAGPAVNQTSSAFSYSSMLVKPDPINPAFYTNIPPFGFIEPISFSPSFPPTPTSFPYNEGWFQNLVFADYSVNLLGVGWIERAGETNLYDTTKQTLITYSLAHDDLFPNPRQPNGVVLGGYGFKIPATATNGNSYQIQIGRPTATSDGIGAPGSAVFISTPTNGSYYGGAINAIKYVTVHPQKYLVGSVYPFNWFNAGDFGSTNIVNADVEQVFETAIYSLNSPPPGSDFFDAMDSSGNIGVIDGNPSDVNYGYYTNAGSFTAANPTNVSYYVTNFTYTYDTNITYNFTNSFPTTNAPVSTNIVGIPVIITLTSPPILATSNVTENINSFRVVSTNTLVFNYTYTNNYSNVTNSSPTVSTTNTVLFNNTIYFYNNLDFAVFSGGDTNINQLVFGDGKLDVSDVFVTFRRSLDPSLAWFYRLRSLDGTGQLLAEPAINQFTSGYKTAAKSDAAQTSSTMVGSTTPVQVNFAAGNITNCSAGQVVQIPITAAISGGYPLRVVMLNLTVEPLDGSPPLTTAISFSPSAALGKPTSGFTDSHGLGNYAAAWMDNTIAGLTGTATIGTLTVTIPANANSLSAYAIHFDHASGSPNGLISFPRQTLTGLITLTNRSNSSYGDGIPDSWRLNWFGTVNNILSASNACPSGDGINNWMKYVAGVDPNTPNDFPSLNAKTRPSSGAAMSIYWPTVSGKQYAILSSASLFPGNWTTNAIVTGNGANMEFDDNSGGAVKFYRVLILP